MQDGLVATVDSDKSRESTENFTPEQIVLHPSLEDVVNASSSPSKTRTAFLGSTASTKKALSVCTKRRAKQNLTVNSNPLSPRNDNNNGKKEIPEEDKGISPASSVALQVKGFFQNSSGRGNERKALPSGLFEGSPRSMPPSPRKKYFTTGNTDNGLQEEPSRSNPSSPRKKFFSGTTDIGLQEQPARSNPSLSRKKIFTSGTPDNTVKAGSNATTLGTLQIVSPRTNYTEQGLLSPRSGLIEAVVAQTIAAPKPNQRSTTTIVRTTAESRVLFTTVVVGDRGQGISQEIKDKASAAARASNINDTALNRIDPQLERAQKQQSMDALLDLISSGESSIKASSSNLSKGIHHRKQSSSIRRVETHPSQLEKWLRVAMEAIRDAQDQSFSTIEDDNDDDVGTSDFTGSANDSVSDILDSDGNDDVDYDGRGTHQRFAQSEPGTMTIVDDDATISSLEALYAWLTCKNMDFVAGDEGLERFDPRGMMVGSDGKVHDSSRRNIQNLKTAAIYRELTK